MEIQGVALVIRAALIRQHHSAHFAVLKPARIPPQCTLRQQKGLQYKAEDICRPEY
jgi:hypothetical protein